MNKKFLSFFIALSISTITFGEINLYGPGGPHTALIEVAKKYKEKTGKDVKVNFGSQRILNDKAKKMQIFYLELLNNQLLQ